MRATEFTKGQGVSNFFPEDNSGEIHQHLDLTKEASWTMKNAELIARQLGLEYNDEFCEELEKFIRDTVMTAVITAFLPNLACNQFKRGKKS